MDQPPVVEPPATVDQPTAVHPPPEALPAGVAPEDVAPSRPSFRDRARLRRRLRYLRRVRELGFRDLGGLAFDLHRFRRRNDELVLGKLAALDAVDRELRAIERVLDERRDIIELREPGVAACPRCGALHGSDAHFCPQCGTQFSGPRAIGEVGPGATSGPEVSPAQESLPFSGAEQVATPVSGALAGNPPPPAPPEPEPAPTAAPEAGAEAAPAAEPGPGAAPGPAEAPAPTGTEPADQQPTTVQPSSGVDQPTQAFPALGPDEDGSTLTSGDPLASRERSAE
ncbi:zinc ribbon domain-containing protein [Baekduia sp.]|uniref:zinc ribbon domain-containing protein n=1 Tax=Baekduia sp. TaxID=2600305 RepID=UPI002D76786B|nr:zinc ribbon domain-containing protein [Baekduia sp.]